MPQRHVRLCDMSTAPVQLDRPEADRPEPPDRALAAAETLARWLDGRFVDPLLGLLLPGFGDLLGSALGLYPVLLAWSGGRPRRCSRACSSTSRRTRPAARSRCSATSGTSCSARTRATSRCCARAAGGGAVRAHWSDTLVVGGALLLFVAALRDAGARGRLLVGLLRLYRAGGRSGPAPRKV